MQVQKILLQRNKEGSFDEVGIVVETGRSRKDLVLRRHDGSEVRHRRSPDELVPPCGSLMHLVRLAPENVTRALESRPSIIFKQIIRERGDTTARELKEQLSDFPSELVDQAWERARLELKQDHTIEMSDDRSPTYRYAGEEGADEFVRLFPAGSIARSRTEDGETASSEPGSSVGPATPTNESSRRDEGRHDERDEGRHDERASAVASPQADLVAGADEESTGSEHADRKMETRKPVLELLGSMKGLAQPATLDGALDERPLALAKAFRALPGPKQASLVEALTSEEQVRLAAMVGEGKRSQLRRPLDKASVDTYSRLLTGAIAELKTAGTAGKTLSPLVIDLVGRVTQVGADTPGSLTGLALVVQDESALSRVLDALTQRLRSGTLTSLDEPTLQSLARAAARLPLARSGGRASLLAALYARTPSEVRRPRWWEGVDLPSLMQAGRGTLAKVLEDEVVSETVVTPLVRKYLTEVGSRHAAAALFEMPPSLAKHVTGADFARVLARLEEVDPYVKDWRGAVADTAGRKGLERRLDAHVAELEEARSTIERLTEQNTTLEQRLNSVVQQLASVRSADLELRDEQERQLRIDTMRAFALLVAQVMQSDAARSDEALRRQVMHGATREGLGATAEPGDVVAFDPSVHDPLGRSLVPGNPATVVRSGYTWSHGSEEVLLLRAQVVPLEE